MNKIIHLHPHTTVLASPVKYRETSFEHALTYNRRDGKRVEIALTHLPDISGEGPMEPLLQLATRKIARSNSPNEYISLSMEEARLLRDFLNRPEVIEWLEESL